jgi:hypothetical protein
MNLEVSITSIINIFVMPESNDESSQSLFQGFLGEILNPLYIQNLMVFSIFPPEFTRNIYDSGRVNIFQK